MARLVKEVEPTEKTYLVELTQSEVDFVVGLCHDLSDNRRVAMLYAVDESFVVPTADAQRIASGVASSLVSTHADDYDYFEYWEQRNNALLAVLDWEEIKGAIEQE